MTLSAQEPQTEVAASKPLPAYPAPIVNDSYWPWPERNLAGDVIDLDVQVLGRYFHDAMRQITGQ